MNRKHLIALSILALVGSNAALAQDSGSALSHAEGEQRYVREYGIDLPRAQSAVTREEVLADLQIWRESGLAALEGGEAGADVNSVEYRRAAAKYAELRSSPQFHERVEQIARQRGKPVTVVGR